MTVTVMTLRTMQMHVHTSGNERIVDIPGRPLEDALNPSRKELVESL